MTGGMYAMRIGAPGLYAIGPSNCAPAASGTGSTSAPSGRVYAAAPAAGASAVGTATDSDVGGATCVAGAGAHAPSNSASARPTYRACFFISLLLSQVDPNWTLDF